MAIAKGSLMPRYKKGCESHNRSGDRLYMRWAEICSRCRNPNHSAYAYYGGRGIKVCDKWAASFLAFANDVGEIPKDPDGKYLTIDRIDNNGNYEPGNVRWATMAEQVHNRRVRTYTEGDLTLTLGGWAKHLQRAPSNVSRRLRTGKPLLDLNWRRRKAIPETSKDVRTARPTGRDQQQQ